ncbi:MAG: DUF4153 domain-containing protein [bacterium]
MKLPSFRQLLQDSARTSSRFPLVFLAATVGTVAAILLVDHEGPPQPTILFNILLAAILGIPLLIALVLFAERQKWSFLKSGVLQFVGILFLVGYALTVPSNLIGAPAITFIRLSAFALALHLLVSVAPFITKDEINGFWQFNKMMLLQSLVAILYSIILYAGLSLALAALDNLFGMDVPGKRYGELWIAINGIVMTWFFLSGVPHEIEQLETTTDYPKALRVFGQYILLPMLIIYGIILYAYLGKILLTWSWPEGWVGRLILGFAGSAFFTFVILYPIRHRIENQWIPKAMRWFLFLLIPQIVILFPALWRRISEYGMTESRYIGLLLGVWITVMTVYFLFSKKQNIKLIPGSLCILAILTSIGPWSMFEISERSQIGHLQELLTKNSILINSTIQRSTIDIPFKDTKQISSILDYLFMIHGYTQIQPWFSESLLTDSPNRTSWYKEPSEIAKILGVTYVRTWYGSDGTRTSFTAKEGAIIDIKGYDYLLRAERIGTTFGKKEFANDVLACRISDDLTEITLMRKLQDGVIDSMRVNLTEFFTQCVRQNTDVSGKTPSLEQLTLERSQPGLKVKFAFRQIQLNHLESVIKPLWYEIDIFFSAQ